MVAAAGWATLPMSFSMRGVVEELQKSLVKPTEQAAKAAGQAITKNIAPEVDKLDKAVRSAQYRQKKAAEEQAAAEQKLVDAKSKAVQAVRAVEIAETNRAAAVEKAAAKTADAEAKYRALLQDSKATAEQVEKAELAVNQARAAEKTTVLAQENKLAKARDESRKAALGVEAAEQKVVDAMSESSRATKSLEDKTKDLKSAQDGAGDAATEMGKQIAKAGDEAKTASGGFGDLVGKLGSIGGAIAGVAGASGFALLGKSAADAASKVANQMGYTGAAAEEIRQSIGDVMRGGVAASAEEAAEAVGSLESQFKYLGFEGEQTASELSDNFLAFTQTFGVDMAEATQTAGQLIQNGLASDVENAADLMTTAMQRVPAQMRDELPEIINEYGTNFRALGFTGEEAFGLLVSASEKGKWALDKTGDALKEFTIRGSDMSQASQDAYAKIGLSAEDMSRKIAEGGPAARDALEQTAKGILAIEDPAERANTAIALFGTPLEDLSVDQIPQFLDSLSGADGAMGNFAGSSQALADNVKNSLDGRLNALKGTVTDLASDGFMWVWDVVQNKVIPAFQDVGDWVQRNEQWVGPLAAAIGAAAAAWGMWTGAILLWKGVTAIATGVQAAFNAVMAANPIMLVTMAVAGLVAGLTYFFTQTETGQAVWQSLMDALGSAWEWLQSVFTPVFQWMGGVITGVWNGIKAGWDILWGALQFGWESIIKPILDAFWLVARVTIGAIAAVVFFPLKLAWEALSFGIQLAWVSIIKPAWDALAGAANWLWTVVLQPIFGFIGSAWNLLATGIQLAWDTIIRPAWDALSAALNWMWNSVVSPILTWIGDKWNAMGAGIRWVKDNIIQPVFDGIGSALDTLQGWFRTAVDNIGKTWDMIKDKTSAPIRWVVDTVYNNGIKKIWDNIADFIGLEKLPAVELKFARGGVLPGYTPGRDVHTFVSPTGGRLHLSGGEAIMRPEWTRAVGGPAAVEAMNKAAREGKLVAPPPAQIADNKRIARAHHHALGGIIDIGAFAEGGVIAAMERIVGEKYPMLVPVFSGYRPGSADYHGQGLAGDFSNGTGNTPEMTSLANDIAKTYPGSLELIHEAPGFDKQIKNGQFVGGGGGSWGFYAGAGDHTNHVHWAMDTPPTLSFGGGVFEGGSSSGGNAGGGWLRSKIKGIWDGIINPIKEAIPTFPGMVGGIPKNAFTKITDEAWKFISSKIPFGGGSESTPGPYNGGGAEQWRGLAREALKRHGYNPDELIDITLQQIDIESGGNPNAVNNWDSNAAAGNPSGGLLQVIPTTFDSMYNMYPEAFAGLARNNLDPLANLVAGIGWTKHAYGGPANVWPTRAGYALGGVLPKDLGVFDTGGLLESGKAAVNRSGKPERVLDPAFTRLFDKRFLPIVEDMVRAYDAWASSDEAKQIAESVQKSAESAAVDTSKSLLSPFGLDPAVNIGMGAGKRLQSAWDASGMDVGIQGRNVTVTIEAEEGQDRVSIDQLQRLEKEVDWLKVNVNRKPKAAAVTRGGVM